MDEKGRTCTCNSCITNGRRTSLPKISHQNSSIDLVGRRTVAVIGRGGATLVLGMMYGHGGSTSIEREEWGLKKFNSQNNSSHLHRFALHLFA